MRTLLLTLLILTQTWAQAQTAPDSASECRSQLIRMQIDGNTVNQTLQSSQEVRNRALPALRTFIESDAFKKSFIKEYPIDPVGFPFNRDICEREKARDPKFKDVDCNDSYLCSTDAVSEEVKARVCFSLPCSFIMGSRMETCASTDLARPTALSFPSPINLKTLDLSPETLNLDDGKISSCFVINAMEVGLGVGIEFNNGNPRYGTIGLDNLDLKLDGPRRVCISATVDFNRTPILGDLQMTPQGSDPFVSNAMIDAALRSSRVSGLTGYTPQTLEVLKLTGLPPLARHFRPSLETAIAGVLSSTFETSIQSYLTGFSNAAAPSRVDTPSDSLVSELGVGNFSVKKYVDLLECSVLKQERARIPGDHACLNTPYPGSSKPLTVEKIPSPDKAAQRLQEAMDRNTNVTSETLRKRLEDLGPRLEALRLKSLYDSRIAPLLGRIRSAQSESTLMSGIELVGSLSNNSQLTVGFCLPELCNKETPSAHENRSIANCPIQAYVDINELNNIMASMYQSGRLCNRGRGDFVPERNDRGEILRDKGFARGEGCVMAIEDDPDGLRCYLNGAPTLKFDPQTQRYNVNLRTKECYRGGVFIGQGKIGGDIDFNIGFTPSICNGGDFCLGNGNAEWSVAPGTARYALRDSSWFNGIVKKTIDKTLSSVVSETLRFPVSSTQGPLANVPLAPEGRVDIGEGYFGACLEIK